MISRLFLGAMLAGVAPIQVSFAQPVVVEGLKNCVREDRGRAVCEIAATGRYTFVDEGFYFRYRAAVANTERQVPPAPSPSWRDGARQPEPKPSSAKQTDAKADPPKANTVVSKQCSAGVPPPLPPLPISAALPPHKQDMGSCTTVSELVMRLGRLKKAAQPAKDILNEQTALLQTLRANANAIVDGCPEDFRCENTNALQTLRSLQFDRMSEEATAISSCAGVLLDRLFKSDSSNEEASFNKLSAIEAESFSLDRELAANDRIARRRMTGFDANLKQCRETQQ